MNASVEKKSEDGKPYDGNPRDDKSEDEELENGGDKPQNGSQRRPEEPLFEGSPVEADSFENDSFESDSVESAHGESAGSSSDCSSPGDIDSPSEDSPSEHSSGSTGSGEDTPDLFQGNTSPEDTSWENASQGPAEPREDEETKQLNVSIPATLHEQLKIESVRRDTPMKVLVARLLSENL